MSPRAPGRSKRRYAMSRLRLVNFHNLVDETIELRDGGHLFLLGDNGSGKTTVLDAMHLVLSGGSMVEFNAAARVGGRRGEGRSLAGIVLRHDAERGVINEGGAITYAVLELIEQRDGGLGDERICVGVGLEATTLDARVTRWGIVHRGGLDTLPLLTPDATGGLCPTPREELRAALPKPETFGHITDYRAALAATLFGGVASYEDVCRFWSMAKSYREIVAGARDFATLFERLLPAPDPALFGDILRSLRELEELDTSLTELGEQLGYVRGLEELLATVTQRKEEVARYEWLTADWRGKQHDARVAGWRTALVTAKETRQQADAQRRLAEHQLQASVDARLVAEQSDADGLGRRLREAEATLRANEAMSGSAVAELEAATSRQARAQEECEGTSERLAGALEAADDEIAARLERRDLPGALPEVARLVSRERELAIATKSAPLDRPLLPEAPSTVFDELAAQRELALSAQRERREAASLARAEAEIAERSVTQLLAVDDVSPLGPGLERALASLNSAGIAAAPLYRLLRPATKADATLLAGLEALAGEITLGTVVTDAPNAHAARSLVLDAEPGLRVATRSAPELRLPGWAARLLEDPATALEERARAALALALSQPDALGRVEAPDATFAVELRGAAFRAGHPLPRFVGEAARGRELERRRDEARATAEDKARLVEQLEARVAQAERAVSDIGELERVVRALRTSAVQHALGDLRQHLATHASRSEERSDRQRRAARAATALAESKELLLALRSRAEDAGLAELERHLAELRRREDLARGHADKARGRFYGARKEIEDLERDLLAADAQGGGLAADQRARADALRLRLGRELPDADLLHYVMTTRGGQKFKSLEGVTERLREAERERDRASDELCRDGSRGVRYLRYAGRFGFNHQPSEDRVEDRRGAPLSSVRAELEQTLAEQKSVVNERTKDLMDTLVLGSLARELQAQVESLRSTVRDINRLLADLRFGTTRYQFRVGPRAERKELVELVRRLSILDTESRSRFRAFIEERLDELGERGDGDGVPELLDYRRWYDYRLAMRTTEEGGETELTREKRRLGSGGEQGVPNYLLVLALAKLMFDKAGARVRPLLFDEAFYGIDAGRRDELLRFATDLGLQVVVASPDQDGATAAVRRATTLFLLKDEGGDVHLAPYHYWNRAGEAQPGLFDEGADESPPEDAHCEVHSTTP